jgi:HD-GYP domain-containing protein (c-di-GMP phosphodiesterase class II)
MKAYIHQLQKGCILSEDVNSLSSRPIIPKKTVLTNEHIKLLKAFLIKEVHVESMLVNGQPFSPIENGNESSKETSILFTSLYLQSVRQFKVHFKSWQAGSQIDIVNIRKFFVPLLESALQVPSEIFKLHHYSTKEEYQFHHSVSVGILAGYLSSKLTEASGEWIQIAIAGLLSDCGMAKISPNILDKKSALSPEEFELIKQHTTHGYKMLQNLDFIRDGVRFGVLQHHERIDGSGYPLGIQGERIHFFAKIISVADVFHAMTSERQYRTKQSPFRVIELMRQVSFGQFELSIIEKLTEGIVTFLTGSKIRLSNNQIGEVIFKEPNNPTRPIVKLEGNNEIISLQKRRELFIEEVIS